MHIGAFARAAGLSVDTVRFYVREGLLQPGTGEKGGSNRYLVFTAADVEQARLIRLAKTLGFPLKLIRQFAIEMENGALSDARSLEIVEQQIDALTKQADELAAMLAYLRAKAAWLRGGKAGPAPAFAPHADASAFSR